MEEGYVNPTNINNAGPKGAAVNSDITPFEQIVENIDAGEHDPSRHVMAQVNDAILRATRAVMASGKKAGITVKISVAPHAQRQLVAAIAIDTKLPNPPLGAVRLFGDGMGNLHATDPQQGALFPITGGGAGSTRSSKHDEET